MPPPALTTLRALCLGLPEAREVEAWGAPTFRVKTIFAMYSSDPTDEGPDGSVWVKSTAPNQAFLIRMDPGRFFSPPYVGPKGWTGVRLDRETTDWAELKGLLWEAWTMSVPKKLLAQHAEPPAGW